ncbi:MAG: MBL fold metallo-hydrolase [Solirubrobacterales bacterium]
MKLQLIRHATIILTVNNKRILVDPVLSKAGAMEPIEDVPNQNWNPLVELPLVLENILDCDAVLVTHTHSDHFDKEAVKLLPKTIPVFCQPQDELKLKSYGFAEVHPVNTNYIWNDITINRTGGMHGHGDLALEMAPVSGFVISHSGEPTIYIAGDTVFCKEVQEAIKEFKPEIVVCNCGGAQFGFGEPITMDIKDIKKLSNLYPDIKIIAVHMEAWNHCRVTRKELKALGSKIIVPENGDVLSL